MRVGMSKSIEENVSKITPILEALINRLKKIGQSSDVLKVQNWLVILKDKPSKDDLNDIWGEIQRVGHMSYMDYLDDDYQKIIDSLKSQMLDIIILARSSQ
jgi:hypothetical protein